MESFDMTSPNFNQSERVLNLKPISFPAQLGSPSQRRHSEGASKIQYDLKEESKRSKSIVLETIPERFANRNTDQIPLLSTIRQMKKGELLILPKVINFAKERLIKKQIRQGYELNHDTVTNSYMSEI